MEKGYIQVYTGDGKGKTTAAVGLGVRACGQGLAVFMVQFLKGCPYGEILAIRQLSGRFDILQSGLDSFVEKGNPSEEDLRLARQGLEAALSAVESGEYDLVILDEVNIAVDYGVLEMEEVLHLLDRRPAGVEVVLTGRNAHLEFLKRADLVTEMKEVRHYYDHGVKMRKGIEY